LRESYKSAGAAAFDPFRALLWLERSMNWSGLVIGIESACILLFVVMLIGSLVTERGKELMFHGFIAGLVGVGLVVFDFGVRFLLLQKPEDAPLWAIILAVFGVFIAIFVAVVCLDAVLEQRSVPLESVGVIDGDYVDVVFDDGGKMTSASTINISSTKRSGFAIRVWPMTRPACKRRANSTAPGRYRVRMDSATPIVDMRT
jgi:hypothetical protein